MNISLDLGGSDTVVREAENKRRIIVIIIPWSSDFWSRKVFKLEKGRHPLVFFQIVTVFLSAGGDGGRDGGG